MSGVDGVSGSSSNGATPAVAAQSASASYDTFMKLLTTQLQHQDPLNPTNTDTFTSEMIQLSGVEQELAINNTLGTISTNLSSISTSNGLGYIGKTVTATGETSPMQNGAAKWSYDLDSTAKNVTLTVEDSSGNALYSTSGENAAGSHTFSWDGTNTGGNASTSGDFILKVTATDSTGASVKATTNIIGTVTGVDTSSGVTSLQMGDIEVPLSDVTSLSNS